MGVLNLALRVRSDLSGCLSNGACAFNLWSTAMLVCALPVLQRAAFELQQEEICCVHLRQVHRLACPQRRLCAGACVGMSCKALPRRLCGRRAAAAAWTRTTWTACSGARTMRRAHS